VLDSMMILEVKRYPQLHAGTPGAILMAVKGNTFVGVL